MSRIPLETEHFDSKWNMVLKQISTYQFVWKIRDQARYLAIEVMKMKKKVEEEEGEEKVKNTIITPPPHVS